MAKKIPAKRSDREKKVEEALKLFQLATDARYKIALAAYEAQDADTKNAIDGIRDRLTTIATGTIRIFPDGKRGASYTMQISTELVDANTLYIATEIIKDLAYMDIRVANYEFPTVYCADCGDKLTMKKKAKSGR